MLLRCLHAVRLVYGKAHWARAEIFVAKSDAVVAVGVVVFGDDKEFVTDPAFDAAQA